MKANELMIGDRIRFKYLPRHDDEIFDGVVNPQMFLYPSDFEIIPIPITSAILEKNGFVADEPEEKNSAYRLNEEEAIIVECFPNKNGGYRSIFAYGNIRIRMTLNYLHQLQHAFRLCGIEKEIEP